MAKDYEKVRAYLQELDYMIVKEDKEDEVFVIESEIDGIKNLVIGCADPILIMEQYIFEIPNGDTDVFKKLLIKNRDIVHGAFVLAEDGKRVLFRDTLQLENLDLNELEGSINALSLLLSEYSDEIIEFSKH
ncbi:Putative sensory transduction regulator [Lishizhenia tianjinensis]|uniref:Putative sensory transduction regulator n=1 Tax=Lishizhenia tianjinensis TaxID=477690 RepID=A0A1I6YJK7_9FLAO|nr:YbjN domain-containing protein [Lishizhenia tianjinensis]SFT50673.1 Putative sensory transduction regulator [Lishizhenia tianjinensis]